MSIAYMNITQVEVLLIGLFGLCLGAYYIGKKKKINLVRCIGKNGSIVTLVLLVVNGLFIVVRRGID
jgi:fucose permease